MEETRFIASRDGKRLRVATWDAAPASKPRGVCVLLDGQTEFLEKYDEVIGELRSRGFAVATLDWRGQGGSVRALANPLKAHIGDFAEYDEDLSTFLEKVVKPMSEKPPIALAHSMGGHVLLRALHDRPNAFTAAVMTAPMLRAQTRGYPAWLARAMCRFENAIGNSEQWVWGMDQRDPLTMEFEDNLVTSDRTRFARAKALVAAQSDIRLAGPTWGWLEAAYRSMARVTSPGYGEAIATPVLIVGAGKDRIVDMAAEREFARRLPNGAFLEFSDAEHEILMESDAIRMRFWAAFDAFVGKYV
jgi:lysophospholipase